MVESDKDIKRLATIGQNEKAFEALRKLSSEPKGSAVLVVDDSGHLVGIVTNRDLRFLSASELDQKNGILVKDIMTKSNLICGPPDTTEAQAIDIMKNQKTKRLILIDIHGRPVDLVSAEHLKHRDMTCFVLFPFKEPYFTILNDHIKPVLANNFNIKSIKADDIFRPEAVIETIQRLISVADVIIADITERNPNVYYEVGYAHGLKKKVIFFTQKIKDIPFDISHLRCIGYKYTRRGVKNLEQDLIKAVRAVLNEVPTVGNI
jgi:CBS domain-containing protein